LQYVPVVSSGKPLMPCRAARCRQLVKESLSLKKIGRVLEVLAYKHKGKYIVRNKQSGNIYAVSKFRPDHHERVDKEELQAWVAKKRGKHVAKPTEKERREPTVDKATKKSVLEKSKKKVEKLKKKEEAKQVMHPRLKKMAGIVRDEIAEHFSGNVDDDLSTYCAISSYVLMKIGYSFGYKFRLAEGVAFELGWHPTEEDINHCWLEIGDDIVDITATQFGRKEKVYIVRGTNESYKKFKSDEDALKSLRKWPSEQSPVRQSGEKKGKDTKEVEKIIQRIRNRIKEKGLDEGKRYLVMEIIKRVI